MLNQVADHPTEPISAGIDAFAWLSGRWSGHHGPDEIEEQWSGAAGDGMIGMFRAITNGRPRFYELIALDAEGEGLVCRFRHFNRDLTGWEEKDAPLELDLVALTEQNAVFLRRGKERWMTYRREPDDRLTVFFEGPDGQHDPNDEYRFARG